MTRRVWLIEWRYRNAHDYPRGWQTYFEGFAAKTEAVAEAKAYASNWHRTKEWRVASFLREPKP